MKKIYQAPKAQQIVFEAQMMLAASNPHINVNNDVEVDAGDSFSNGKGWSSDAWTADE